MLVFSNPWWAFVLRGVIAVLFGVLSVVLPHVALLTLIYLFGFYALTDGFINIASAFRGDSSARKVSWGPLLVGLLSITAGVLTFFMPGITGLVLLYIIAIWAWIMGVLAIVTAIRLRKLIKGEWLLALSGVLSILFGMFAALFPGAGALAMVIWIGAYSTVTGAMLIALGIKLRNLSRTLDGPVRPVAAVATGH